MILCLPRKMSKIIFSVSFDHETGRSVENRSSKFTHRVNNYLIFVSRQSDKLKYCNTKT